MTEETTSKHEHGSMESICCEQEGRRDSKKRNAASGTCGSIMFMNSGSQEEVRKSVIQEKISAE